jgi:antagonist of KipI
MNVQVLGPGLLTCVQDRGRHGHAAIGVGNSGAMDAVALRLANALVGNADDAAGLEMTLRGPRLRFTADTLVAITGAEVVARCGATALPAWRPLAIRAGSEVVFAGMRRGARACLAMGGGIAVAPVLGSRRVEVNAGLGRCAGAPLRAGDELATNAGPMHAGLLRALLAGAPDAAPVVATKWSIAPAPWFDPDGPVPLAFCRGAHFEWLDAASRRALSGAEFRVGSESNRVGYRLEGPLLALAEPLELISEGVLPGTIQLPPGGNPIVLMAEAPTTGGYPRIAHVAAVDLARLAQRKPGDGVRFVEISLDQAQTRYLEREQALARLRITIAERLHP